MRTTIRLPDDLLAEAKQVAARTGRSLTALIEDALREALSRREPRRDGASVELPTFPGSGMRPGVDLDDSAALIELMEESPAPD